MITTLAVNLIGINLLAYFTIILRPRIYKTELYKPMVTNIRLSIIPIAILIATIFLSLSFRQWSYNTGSPILRWASFLLIFMGFMIWLLMLPNSGYLITELNFNHRDHDKVEVPLWYDIVSILSLAMSGVLNMCFNVLALQFMLVMVMNSVYNADMTGVWLNIVAMFLLILCSFGIYLGRYLRLNSWDVKHPSQFIKKLKGHYSEKGMLKNCFLFVVFHSLFFGVFYHATFGVAAQIIFQDLGKLFP